MTLRAPPPPPTQADIDRYTNPPPRPRPGVFQVKPAVPLWPGVAAIGAAALAGTMLEMVWPWL